MNRLLVVTVAAGIYGTALAQSDRAGTDPEERVRQQIAALQDEGAPPPASLIEMLRTLALSYSENGQHALAIAALEEARHVTRVREGLSSADEALLLRQQIRSEKALGRDDRVWDLEQNMVTIARQNVDDIRMTAVFRDLAEDRAETLEEYDSGRFPPEIELGCYYVPGFRRYDDTHAAARTPPPDSEGSCLAGQKRNVTRQLRGEILTYYADAIEVIVKKRDYSSEELRYLEKQAVRMFPTLFEATNWLVGSDLASSRNARRLSPLSFCDAASPGTVDFSARLPSHHPTTGDLSKNLDELLMLEILGSCLEPVINGDGFVTANVGGWPSLVRLIAYEIRSAAPAAARAAAFADLADWHLLNTSGGGLSREENNHRAIELYERAYRALEQDKAARTSMFSPDVPIIFGRNLFASPATQSSRYIDVSFDVTKYGRGERIKILGTSQGVTRAEERDVIRSIEGRTFRPRFVDGRLANSAPVAARYPLDP